MFALVNKPSGVSSFWATVLLRNRFATRKIGHSGTLDPLATGLLLMATDESTKLIPYLADTDKTYRFSVDFSATSASLDLGTERIGIDSERLEKLKTLTEADILAVLPRFTGEITQVPPSYSAVKVNWRRAYRIARYGADEAIEMPERSVTVHSLSLLGFDSPIARFEARVSSGTYVRSLARDIGAALGVSGLVTSLDRTAIGEFSKPDEGEVVPLDDTDVFPWRCEEVSEWERDDIRNGTRIENRFSRGLDEIFIARHDGKTISVLQVGKDGKCSIRRNLNN